MVQNLTESLLQTPWLLWLSVAAVALVSESIERGGWLGRLGVALAAGAVVAALVPHLWWAQWLVALAVAAALFAVPQLRPRADRRGEAETQRPTSGGATSARR